MSLVCKSFNTIVSHDRDVWQTIHFVSGGAARWSIHQTRQKRKFGLFDISDVLLLRARFIQTLIIEEIGNIVLTDAHLKSVALLLPNLKRLEYHGDTNATVDGYSYVKQGCSLLTVLNVPAGQNNHWDFIDFPNVTDFTLSGFCGDGFFPVVRATNAKTFTLLNSFRPLIQFVNTFKSLRSLKMVNVEGIGELHITTGTALYRVLQGLENLTMERCTVFCAPHFAEAFFINNCPLWRNLKALKVDGFISYLLADKWKRCTSCEINVKTEKSDEMEVHDRYIIMRCDACRQKILPKLESFIGYVCNFSNMIETDEEEESSDNDYSEPENDYYA